MTDTSQGDDDQPAPRAADNPFPNTPPWSRRRFVMICLLFASGAAMVTAGACPMVAEPRGLRLIDLGEEAMVYSSLSFVFASSVERLGAWFITRRTGV